jgi:hypothetical protein
MKTPFVRSKNIVYDRLVFSRGILKAAGCRQHHMDDLVSRVLSRAGNLHQSRTVILKIPYIALSWREAVQTATRIKVF